MSQPQYITVPWSPTANYPAGANPWSGQPTQVTPVYTYFTPGQAPTAQEMNDLLYLRDQQAIATLTYANASAVANWYPNNGNPAQVGSGNTATFFSLVSLMRALDAVRRALGSDGIDSETIAIVTAAVLYRRRHGKGKGALAFAHAARSFLATANARDVFDRSIVAGLPANEKQNHLSVSRSLALRTSCSTAPLRDWPRSAAMASRRASASLESESVTRGRPRAARAARGVVVVPERPFSVTPAPRSLAVVPLAGRRTARRQRSHTHR